MNMSELQYLEDHTVAIRAEQAVLGSLLRDNDALDRIIDLEAAHFHRNDHRMIFETITRQVAAGQRADPMTVFAELGAKVEDCLPYLGKLRASAASSVNIAHHAAIISDKARKRALGLLAVEMQELAVSFQPAAACVDLMASKLEALAQQKTDEEPKLMAETMSEYLGVLQARLNGEIKPVATGHRDLDERLDGGLERGTLTVVAGRPAMGKTAFGLGIARNIARDGGVALFLSMEMSRTQVHDRNVSAIARVPLGWLRKPGEGRNDTQHWDAVTHSVAVARDLRLFIDDKTGLNMLEIRAKARSVKRKSGGALDVVVIDQLSFITGGKSDKEYMVVGEYTRALVALSKELDIAVILLCQLNRDCEKRPNKRPLPSDLGMSGSIEQDAANIMLLYRDEVYNPESKDKGICEVNSAKQRQGQPGVVALNYIGGQTRFEDLQYPWRPPAPEEKPARRQKGFD
jgi:replicative DNA helicase